MRGERKRFKKEEEKPSGITQKSEDECGSVCPNRPNKRRRRKSREINE